MDQANGRQVGGDHYQVEGEQHWDRVWRLYGRGYFVGNITKYVERYHLKNGVEDLKKAQHYIQKLIELEQAKAPPSVARAAAERVVDYSPEVKEILDDWERRRKLTERLVPPLPPMGQVSGDAGPGYVSQDR